MPVPNLLKPSLKNLAALAILSLPASASAGIVVNESFTGYNSAADLVGQAATGVGLTGNWGGSQFYRTDSTGLTMTGVASSGGSLKYPGKATDSTTKYANVAFSSPLSSSTTYYGSYLFQFTANGTTGRTVGGVLTGTAASDTDNLASFAWLGDNFNSTSTVNGPGIRTEGSTNVLPSMSLTSSTTYVMLFEFNANAKTTSAWVLSQDQLTNFYGSLDAATLNAATTNTTSASGVTWRSSITGTNAVGSMNYLIAIGAYGNNSDNTYIFRTDEIRFSDANLLESVTAVPEPSTIAIGLALGAVVIGRTISRRRRLA